MGRLGVGLAGVLAMTVWSVGGAAAQDTADTFPRAPK